ncbi:MAG: response regulator [Bacteroidales bacterium]|jgi:signal transduction histidine kinase/ligand-binding sensor domain-containing protein/DNA-binding response OmpR family regulator|nr:response regulator [Bacteroidales bacterium]
MCTPVRTGLLILLLLTSFTTTGICQLRCAFTHYSVEDGLSEGVALTMHQDREGFMWFGTFDGLNRFDGYSFKVFKSGFRSNYALKNNRVDRITEDDLGYLWIMNNDGEVYRMNPQTEEFINFNQISSAGPENYSPVTQIYSFTGGETWLSTESGSSIRVISSADSSGYRIDRFDLSNGMYAVNLICKDNKGTTWILSDNGLFRQQPSSAFTEKVSLRLNSSDQPDAWFSFYELDDRIWFGTGDGTIVIADKDGRRLDQITLGIPSDIIAIKPLNQRELLILTSGDGFFVYTPLTGEKRHFERSTYPEMASDEMVSLYVDRFGEVWFETTADGVLHFDPLKGTLKHFRMKVDKTNPNVLLPSFFIFEDKNDYLWIYPRGGGFSLYNRVERKLEYFYNEPGSPDRRFPNLIHSALPDDQGNLWMCTIQRGIEKVSFFPNQFSILRPNPESATHSENEVRAIFEDRDRYLWVATRDGYVYLYDPERKIVGYLRENGSFRSGTPFNGLVYSITQDNTGNIWMGSKGRGLFRMEPDHSNNTRIYNIKNFRHNPSDPYSLSHDNVYSVCEDQSGRIWVGTFNGGLNFIVPDDSGIKFINSGNLLKSYPYSNHKRVRYITSDQRGNIWVGTTNGLLIFNQAFTDPSTIDYTSCFFDPEDEMSLANNDVHYIYCSPDNEIYVATFGGGLNRVLSRGDLNEKPRFRSYTVRTGAPDDVILSIVDDLNGNLWLSSERGILKFTRESESFEIYSDQSGVDPSYFSEATGIRTAGNEIMFGYDKGIYSFNPSLVRKTNFVPPLVFTRVLRSGTEIHPAEMNSSSREIDNPELKLELSHRQKSLNIEYSALDYRNPKNIQYAHMLEGIDDDWFIERGQRAASYTNLNPGDYLFKVRSTNSDGIWVDNQRNIRIIVNPSFWQTAFSKILMVTITLMLIALTIYIIFTFYKLRHKVEVEQLITNLKLKFFTDVSHELRTPLTLISSPINNILENNSLEPEVKDQLTLVKSNTERMLRLVNQILDFRKVQSRKMRLRIEEFPLGKYITEICSDFRKIAEDKGIILEVRDESVGETVWADRDKVEKIAFNLITNALKFTPRGKKVTVSIVKNNNALEFIVADQGTGLSKEKMKNLFMRFGSDDGPEISLQPGTGIGLSLSRELAELHQAQLVAESEEGKGATFRVIFKIGFSHYNNDTEFVLSDSHHSVISGFSTPEPADDGVNADENDEEDKEPLLLFVEDNEELRSFLKIILADSFHIIEAGNGSEGFEIARSQLPDLIITDLMMPEMDGLELARRLREEVTTSHIPVVVLTAKTDLDTQIEALRTGADDFITKPFSSTYLKAKIESILLQRKKLQESFLSGITDFNADKQDRKYEVNPSIPVIESYDDKMLKRLMEIMEKNIENSALTVEELVSMIGLGRSVFFKKLKSLTGLAPIEFIREVRVKRAAQLIESGQYTISQVTYMVGCNDPRYFSRIFKHRFGVTPSEYREKHSKQKQSDTKFQ